VNFVFKQLSVASLDGNLHFSENELKVSDTEGKRYWHPNAPPQHPFKNLKKTLANKKHKNDARAEAASATLWGPQKMVYCLGLFQP